MLFLVRRALLISDLKAKQITTINRKDAITTAVEASEIWDYWVTIKLQCESPTTDLSTHVPIIGSCSQRLSRQDDRTPWAPITLRLMNIVTQRPRLNDSCFGPEKRTHTPRNKFEPSVHEAGCRLRNKSRSRCPADFTRDSWT